MRCPLLIQWDGCLWRVVSRRGSPTWWYLLAPSTRRELGWRFTSAAGDAVRLEKSESEKWIPIGDVMRENVVDDILRLDSRPLTGVWSGDRSYQVLSGPKRFRLSENT